MQRLKLSLILIAERDILAKGLKLQMSVLHPSMEIAQPMPGTTTATGSIALFPNFKIIVTSKDIRIIALVAKM